jgi:hypothetical protein
MSTTKPTFDIWVPLEAYEKSGELRIRGIVSTEHRDKEGEIVLQDGLDFSEFLEEGYFNDNHSKGTGSGAVLGYPSSIKKSVTRDGKKCHIVDGLLYKKVPAAREIHALGCAMQEDPAKARSLGFSLQGGIEDRSGPRRIAKQQKDGSVVWVGDTVKKAVVRHVAITHCPVNPKTQMEALTKALMAGGAVEAPAASPGEGFPLRTESLDGKKKRTKREAIEWLMKSRGISREAAKRVYALAKIRQERGKSNA